MIEEGGNMFNEKIELLRVSLFKMKAKQISEKINK